MIQFRDSVVLDFDLNAEPFMPTIEVTPTEGLVDGQDVTITGANFSPGLDVYVVQCAGSERGDADIEERNLSLCDINPVIFATVGDDGTFTLDANVRDEINGNSCRETPCAFAAGDIALSQVAIGTELFFA